MVLKTAHGFIAVWAHSDPCFKQGFYAQILPQPQNLGMKDVESTFLILPKTLNK